VTPDGTIRARQNQIRSRPRRFESEHALEIALEQYRHTTADFADCVHVALAAQAGESPLWTFNKRAAKVGGTSVLR
jgi:predicted nucleic-acid-binding protein